MSRLVKVLFITVAPIGSVAAAGIYSDLLREFRDHGHEVYVVSPAEGSYGLVAGCTEEDGIRVVRVRTGSVTKAASILKKGLATLRLESQFIAAVRRYFGSIRFDLVLYTSPPVNIDRLLGSVKRRSGAMTYLMLKDIFPQNAVDLGLMRAGGLVWRYFRRREMSLYRVSDHIGCMSDANVRYLLEKNPEIDPARVEVCPNAISPRPFPLEAGSRVDNRERHGVPDDALLLVYGGNLGVPQGVDFLLDVLGALRGREDVFVLIVGSGTEYARIARYLADRESSNVRLEPAMPRGEFTGLLAAADVGLVFLDKRFTIPNFPSRLTAYLEAGLPVISATDAATDLPDVLESRGCGLGVRAGDLDGFIAAVESLLADPEGRRMMGLRGRALLEAEYTSAHCYEVISAHVSAPGVTSVGELVVRDMGEEDVEQVVDLHMDAMPDFFLTSLGRKFLACYYGHLVHAGSAVAKVAVTDDGRPVGFVVGSTDPAGFYGRLLRRHWFDFAWSALPAALRHPVIVPRLVRALRYPGTQPVGEGVGGLYSIGVRRDLAGRGIGRRLVTSFTEEAAARGCGAAYLHADAVGNDHWNSLLQRMGWVLRRPFETPEGRKMNEYWVDLKGDDDE